MQRVLITGGAGFIASHVADRLLGSGQQVLVVDNFDPYYDPAQKARNVEAAKRNGLYELVVGDVCDAPLMDQLFARFKPDWVLHLAARAGVRASVEDPHAYLRVNEQGGLNILAACLKYGKIPLCLASTSSVYGNSSPIPFREDAPAILPLSPYAASKRSSELMAYTYHYLHQLPVAVLRFFTVYGPRGRPDMALAKFTEALLAGRPLRLHGEETERDFTYVDDIVDGVLGAASWLYQHRGFETFNLGRSQPVRVRRLIELLAERLKVSPQIELGQLEPSESVITCADTGRARLAFGYEPRVSLSQGVEHWAEWYLNHPESPAQHRG